MVEVAIVGIPDERLNAVEFVKPVTLIGARVLSVAVAALETLYDLVGTAGDLAESWARSLSRFEAGARSEGVAGHRLKTEERYRLEALVRALYRWVP